MIRAVALSLLVSAPAWAGTGTLNLAKKGPFPARVWVDGEAQGKVKGKKPVAMQVEAGTHEVWYAADNQGIITLCHGLVDVAEGGQSNVEFSTPMSGFQCTGVRDGLPNGPTAFKGAMVSFRVDSEVDAWVSIDNGQAMSLPSMPFELNLGPGSHTFVLYRDVMQESVFDQGAVTLQAGQRAMVTCTTAGCTGFDQPPVVMVELQEAPQIQVQGVVFPSISMSVGVSAETTTTTSSSSSVTVGGSAGGASGSITVEVTEEEETTSEGVSISIDVDAGEDGGSISIDVDVED